MSEKAARRQARQEVAAYHEAELAELVAHVAGAIDQFRDGDLDPFDMDRVLFQYGPCLDGARFCRLKYLARAPLPEHAPAPSAVV